MSATFHKVAITQAHAAVLARVHGEAFTDAWDIASFLSAVQQPGAFGFIFARDSDDEPLGFVLLRAALFEDGGGEVEVLTIATRPQARRQGLARQAMDAACKHAQRLGAERVYLEVAADNPSARGLYDSLGFREVGRRKGYYARSGAARVDAIVMALSL